MDHFSWFFLLNFGIHSSNTISLKNANKYNVTNSAAATSSASDTFSRIATVTSASTTYYLLAQLTFTGATLYTSNSFTYVYAARIA